MKTVSTVVSIVPVPIKINKPGLYPGNWRIPQADDNRPVILEVTDSYFDIYLGVERGTIKINVTSLDIAKSIVEDYTRSAVCSEAGAEPGIFYVSGHIDDVNKQCAAKLIKARTLQRAWYERLIRMADDDWTKSGHTHRSVSNLQREVAKKLGLQKEWIFSTAQDVPQGSIKCPACKSLIDNDSILCAHCNLILRPEEYKKFQFAGK